MRNQELQLDPPQSTGDAEVVRCLEEAIKAGKHWYTALLEAIGLWTCAEETDNERTYRYLIAGEAFDWLLLTERLCAAVDALLPDDEKNRLLFYGKPPLQLSEGEFRNLIGNIKHQQYLNYFYGIIVEEALILAVQEDVRKEWRTRGFINGRDAIDEPYRRIYGATKTVLLKRFRQEKGYPQIRSVSLTVLKEFNYWLFKYRLEHCEKTKVASDTRKALQQLHAIGFSQPWT